MPTRGRVQELIDQVQRGDQLAAFEQFYAEDVVMQENTNPPTTGKPANREREKAFYGSLARIERYDAASVLVEGDRVAINWVADLVGADGTRYHFDEIAVQLWRGDVIVHERFVYDSANIVVEPAAAVA